MLVRRFYDDRLAQASYLIGCQKTGEAIVIDPARDVAQYVRAAKQENVRITHVTETHIHADFLSGTRELAAATGATMLLSGEGGDDWQYAFAASDNATLLHDGDPITLGNVRIQVMHSPGHTPEHIAFLVTDGARGEEPVGLVSGDFIFVGDVGRPDLLETAAGVVGSKTASARSLYQSIQRVKSLPDYVQIWPGHGAGSACGKALGSLPSSTLGYERRTNWAFQASNEDEFIASALDGQSVPPRYFATMKRMNREGPPLLKDQRELQHLDSHNIAAAQKSGIVVDTRPLRTFAAGHLHGALNIPPIKAFSKWAGWFLPYDQDLYLIADDEDAANEVQHALAAIGIDRVAGWFDGSAVPAQTAADFSSTKREPMANVMTLLRDGVMVIDLRETHEWDAGHVEGAVNHPLGRVNESLADLPRDTPIAVHCEGGTRSAIGASVLERMGFSNVTDLTGGWSAYKPE